MRGGDALGDGGCGDALGRRGRSAGRAGGRWCGLLAGRARRGRRRAVAEDQRREDLADGDGVADLRRGSRPSCRRRARGPRRRPCRSRSRRSSRPSAIASPGCLRHSRITPSVTDSPIAGIVRSIVLAGPSAAGASAAGLGGLGGGAVAGLGGGRRLGGLGGGAVAGLGGGRGRASPLVEISHSTAPTATVSPSGAWILTITPATGDGNLGVDLVRRDLDDGVVDRDGIADLLVPLQDGALGDRVAHRRHDHFHRGINSHQRPSSIPGGSVFAGRWRTLARRASDATCSTPLFGVETDRAGERPDAADDGDHHAEPERDRPAPHRLEAQQRHPDPAEAVRPIRAR